MMMVNCFLAPLKDIVTTIPQVLLSRSI